MELDEQANATVQQDLEPLFIIEEGDDFDSVMCNRTTDKGQGTVKITEEDNGDTIQENRLPVEAQQPSNECESADGIVKKTAMHKEKNEGETDERRQKETETKDTEADVDVKQEHEAALRTEERASQEPLAEGEGEPHTQTAPQEAAGPGGKESDVTAGRNTKMLMRHKTFPNAETRAKSRGLLSPEDAQKKVNRLSSDFPDALYELLVKMQDGRRLHDQRCSFRLEPRRRCYSEPGTPRQTNKVMFSSMTSLQTEEFFELVVTSQSRRLDDQRAEADSIQPVPPPAQEQEQAQAPPLAQPPAQPKPSERKMSFKASMKKKAAPAPRPKEELYNMILTSQSQGRLEEQRSRAPGPMDDEDFFSLLLKVQGGRMDEQRTELPVEAEY